LTAAGAADFGVYLHIPFCTRRCDYCAFATWADRAHLMDAYADALRDEIAVAVRDGLPPATTVFFGGGTPSLMPSTALTGVLDAVPRSPGAEVTVECNPETVTAPMLAAYRDAGVTRISLGVQSFVPHVLAALGRDHSADESRRAIALVAGAGFASFNVDLILGAAGETMADWKQTLEEALSFGPAHISAYALTVEPGTPLADDRDRFPDDDDQADKYLAADAALAAAGLANYEISNWARPGHECRHNLLYWRQGDYRGFGCAAHSHASGRRWWNVRTPERYIAAVRAGGSVVAGDEVLDDATRRHEAAALALRTRDGVPAALLADAPGDLVTRRDGRAVLTPRGRLLANDVALRLMSSSSGGS
jgi:putative oxygen-independent coproporphyrinogen III oxidase